MGGARRQVHVVEQVEGVGDADDPQVVSGWQRRRSAVPTETPLHSNKHAATICTINSVRSQTNVVDVITQSSTACQQAQGRGTECVSPENTTGQGVVAM
jgi:hypothetical protein